MKSETARVAPMEWVLMLTTAALMVAATALRWWSLEMIEVLGFVTGGICVWLTVREHLWNWPIGLANNVAFFVLFLQARLFADMGLQVVYFGLGIFGWWNWKRGGIDRTGLRPSRTVRIEWLALAAFLVVATWLMREILLAAHGAAPFWDALTTALSLAAQYLLTRKRIENWLFWIAADLIYIPLYVSRDLPLTALLYAVFLVMCLIGLNAWRGRLEGTSVPVGPDATPLRAP